MQKYPPSQDEVLSVFLDALNAERRASYRIAERPDKVERNRAEVDYVLEAPDRQPVAVEVSSAWRSGDAGKEDADWSAFAEAVRGRLRGKAPAEFRLWTPMRIPRDLSADAFAGALAEVLAREQHTLERLHRSSKGHHFTVCGIEVFLSYAREGSGISFGRERQETDGREFREQIKRLVGKKSRQLKRHKEAGRETWLVVFNTFWTAMSPFDVREAIAGALGPEHAHIDHFGVVSGNPPDDAWLTTIQ